ncbi:polysaccharide deacetylase family protein [Dokdonella sp.]|uniref:polysaccharide deacetylase family protein n=1 Tax=Dokdonella sp. TaxID=2291710 RepID=UPI0031C92125|nr:polysaccharide deacetylase family protein [Dokdonella sp.]
MRVPVLTWHSNNILGNDYASNDHLALAEDLRLIRRLGLRIVPLVTLVAVLDGRLPQASLESAVALSFDDGSWFDWHDLEHPTCGPQRGFAGILRDFRRDAGVPVHATSFVIVSPQARATLDQTCLIGCGWWDDAWWREAQREGLLAIENHSWDHNHASLPTTVAGARKGSFLGIDDHAAADAEIRAASDWLDAYLAPHRCSLFAYPYGEASDYLLREYLPHFGHRHRLRAAFGTQAMPVESTSNRWHLPRYVCGQHWRDPAELERLLQTLRRPARC